MQIHENAVSDRFVIDYNEEQVTVRIRPGCTGWIDVRVVDDPDAGRGIETLELFVMHDGETCPIHETEESV